PQSGARRITRSIAKPVSCSSVAVSGRPTAEHLQNHPHNLESAMRLITCKALFITVTVTAGALVLAQSGEPVRQGEPNVPKFEPAFPGQTRAPASQSGVTLSVETFAGPLEHPWGIDRLPGGGFLVTELPGRMRMISENG